MKNLYYQHYKLIQKVVNKMKNYFYFLEREELESEANLIFCLAVKKYRPGTAKFSSFLYQRIYWGLMDYIKIQIKRMEWESEEFINQKTIKSTFVSISKEAKEVIDTIFEMPDELLNLHFEKKVKKYTLEKYFQSKGWKVSVIRSIFKEIKENLI